MPFDVAMVLMLIWSLSVAGAFYAGGKMQRHHLEVDDDDPEHWKADDGRHEI
jgi:hypothetical protein